MDIRFAKETDIPQIDTLLYQVHKVHSDGRPDLFQAGKKKYTDDELRTIIRDTSRPILVAENDGHIAGYAFCILQDHTHDNSLAPIKTLYIDDLCVDESLRGQHVGSTLYQHVLSYAKELGCYNVTLNVWACNESAMRFYEKCGLKVQKTGMETILS
jgi:ribosomal protein S18 acetylase RimI-like enzyme